MTVCAVRWQRVVFHRPVTPADYDARCAAAAAAGHPPSLRRALGDHRSGAALLADAGADRRATLGRLRRSRRGREVLSQVRLWRCATSLARASLCAHAACACRCKVCPIEWRDSFGAVRLRPHRNTFVHAHFHWCARAKRHEMITGRDHGVEPALYRVCGFRRPYRPRIGHMATAATRSKS